MTMTAATLFSGIGAPEMAMPDWHWAWSAEIDKFPAAVLAARHPHTVNLGDVSADGFTTRAGSIARPNVLVFGSPCQSYSVAGKRLGLDDPRGNLALVALGIVGRLKPDWFVFENVPGLLSSAGGRDFGLFLRAVDELGCSLAWTVLDAQHFGVAQRRERVFAVGYLGDWRNPAAVLFEPESLRGHSSPRDQARQEVAGAIGAGSKRSGQRVGRREAAANQLVAGTLTSAMGRRCGQPNDDNPADYLVSHALNAHGGPHGRIDFESETFVCGTLNANGKAAGSATQQDAECGMLVTHALRADGFDASEDGTGRGTPIVAQGFQYKASPSNTLNPSDISPTMDKGKSDGLSVLTNSAVRRLMPIECERLQGFPDDYTAITFRGKPAADGPRYKALGNSMAVPVMRWILSRIAEVSNSSTGLDK